MPLLTALWTINVNGTLGKLNIAAVDSGGNMSGVLIAPPASTIVSGFWDEVAQKLTFTVANQLFFTGFLFQDRSRMPGLQGGVVFTLVGTFQDILNGTTDRLGFGWYAQVAAT